MQPTPPCSAPACWLQTRASGLLLRWELQLGAYSVGFFFFPSQLCCPLSFQNSHRPAGERVSWCLETFPPSQLPPWDRSPSLTLFLSFCLLYFALPSFEESGLPFWVPGVSVRVQKLFCESCSAFKWTFDEFVGEKVVSPSYSFTILGPLLCVCFTL